MPANALGTSLMIVAGFVVGVGYFVLSLPTFYVTTVAASILIVVDLVTRLRRRHLSEWLILPETGGNFLLIPVWFLGCVIILLGYLLPDN
jgi:hypothetical protein